MIAVPVGGVRRDLGRRELAHDAAELLLLRAQVEVHGPTVPASTTVSRVRAPRRFVRPPSCATCRRARLRDRPRRLDHDRRRATRRGRRAAAASRRSTCCARSTAGGFWVGFCAYDLGRAIERVRDAHRRRPAPPRRRLRAVRRPARDPRRRRARAHRRSATAGPDSRRRVRAARRDPVAAPRRSLDAWTSSLDRVDHAAACAHVLELLARRRVLPGEPHPPAHGSDAAPDPVALFDALARAQSGAARGVCTFGAALPGVGDRVGVARAVPARRARAGGAAVETRPIKGTAADAATLAREREGPRRERDDRRPRAQRSRAGVRVRLGAGARALRDRGAPRPLPPREHRDRPAPARRRPRRRRARDVPARVGHRRARSRASCRRSKTSSRCGAACTAARSAGSTPTRGRAELAVAIRTFTIAGGAHPPRRRRRHRRRLRSPTTSGPRPS